jgi:predicted permease
VAEIGLTTVCLLASGLLLLSLSNLLGVDKGFSSAQVATTDINLSTGAYAGRPGARARIDFADRLIARLQASPGVAAVGISTQQFLSGEGFNTRLGAEGTTMPMPERPLASLRGVHGDYFRALGIVLERGRRFEASEAGPVAVISSAAATRLWPGVDPIGKRLRRGGDGSPLIEVVGVAGDVRASRLDSEPTYGIYVPYSQLPLGGLSLAVKATGDSRSVVSAARAAIRELAPDVALSPVRSLDDVVGDSVSDRRFLMRVALSFAGAALFLASIGVYGVLSHVVTQRRAEFGLRVALGAHPGAVRRMVMGDAWRLTALGLAFGIPSALALGSTLRALLFDVVPYDAAVLVWTCATPAATATLAAYLPARRASIPWSH